MDSIFDRCAVSRPQPVYSVIVTFNRKDLLLRCLEAMRSQTRRPDRILVVDNASTDGTLEALRDAGWCADPDFELLALSENTGGAGGFEAGMRKAFAAGAATVWVMDDDAMPHAGALEALLREATDANVLYGSVAVTGTTLSWPMQGVDGLSPSTIRELSQAPRVCSVRFIPFLGLLVSREIVHRIGFPDGSFFLAADDVEFCLRARRHGIDVRLVSTSRIEHPLAQLTLVPLGWRVLSNLRLAPWKRYYDVRNRLIVARRHHGAAFWYSTIPGTVLRLLVTLATEPARLNQVRACLGGTIDALLDRRGRRHEVWIGASPAGAQASRAARRGR